MSRSGRLGNYFTLLKLLPSITESEIRRKRLEKRIRTEDDRNRLIGFLGDSSGSVIFAALILLILGLYVALKGAQRSGSFPDSLISDFYANVATELINIAITVLIIDRLNSRRINRLEKEKTLRQFRSRSNDFALDAVRIARDYGWLFDGSLFNFELCYANLKGAPLEDAYLRSVHLFGANLESANLFRAYLKRAFMEGANLECANLSGSNLKQAVMLGANLRKANLWLANLENAGLTNANLEGAILLQANLTGARLCGAKVAGAIFDQYTLWPGDYDPVKNGATFVENDSFGSNSVTGQYYAATKGGKYTEEGFYRPWDEE